ncbi:MAG TPA: hypothetical protein VGA65_00140, partial [Hyphomicrobium sp.]
IVALAWFLGFFDWLDGGAPLSARETVALVLAAVIYVIWYARSAVREAVGVTDEEFFQLRKSDAELEYERFLDDYYSRDMPPVSGGSFEQGIREEEEEKDRLKARAEAAEEERRNCHVPLRVCPGTLSWIA